MGGCQRTQLASTLVVNHSPDDANAEVLDYWHGLADRPLTTHDEAFHGLIIFNNASIRPPTARTPGLAEGEESCPRASTGRPTRPYTSARWPISSSRCWKSRVG